MRLQQDFFYIVLCGIVSGVLALEVRELHLLKCYQNILIYIYTYIYNIVQNMCKCHLVCVRFTENLPSANRKLCASDVTKLTNFAVSLKL